VDGKDTQPGLNRWIPTSPKGGYAIMEKEVAVINGDRVFDVAIRPGTETREILAQLNLPADFCLSRRDALPFGDTEDVFGIVRTGEKLYASPPATVGLA